MSLNDSVMNPVGTVRSESGIIMDGAIFDMDGTLLDSMPVWHDCGARFLAEMGIEAEPGLGDILFAETPISGARYLIDHYDLDMSVEEVAAGTNAQMEKYYTQEAEFKPGARELLERMKEQGIPMTIASSTARYEIQMALDKLDANRYFDAIFSCGDLNTTKDQPTVFLAAMEAMGSNIPGTWVFEDGLYAARTAADAGFTTVGVYDAQSESDQEELIRCCDYYYRDLREFKLI